jgi:hypothetical protein
VQVTFVLLDDAPLGQLCELDPDRDWREFVTGERAWILQTYLRLRARNLPVQIAASLPESGLAVFSSKQRRLLRRAKVSPDVVLVGVREDVGEALIADFELVQNVAQADGVHRFLMPLWPQPGLLPRDPARGTHIENIAFKGFVNNLAPAFRSEAWRTALQERGLGWLTDAVSYTRDATQHGGLAWNDFRTVDVVLAVRPPSADLYPNKPATKLYNAWHAQLPAVLGPELAYRDLRRSELDYIEVDSAADALAAIDQLRSDPARYAAMIDNGRRRGEEFSIPRLTDRWSHLLFEELPARAQTDRRVRSWRGRSLLQKELARRAVRALGLWK